MCSISFRMLQKAVIEHHSGNIKQDNMAEFSSLFPKSCYILWKKLHAPFGTSSDA